MSVESYKISEELLSDHWKSGWSNSESVGGSKESKKIDWTVYRSDIALCLYVDITSCSIDVDNIKEILRDQGLELSDWNSYQGYTLPLFFLIQCSGKTVAEWRGVSGDQEWLRGQISFQVVESGQEAKLRLDLLLEDTFSDTGTIQPLNDHTLAKILEGEAKSNENISKGHRLLLTQMSKGFETPKARDVLDQWEKGLVQEYESILEGNDA